MLGGGGETDLRIRLRDLLSLSVRLCDEACHIIRSVQLQRDNDGGSSDTLQAELKDPADPRSYLTVADKRAQVHIVSGLRDRFGTALDIVGEEDEAADEVDADSAPECAAAVAASAWHFDEAYVIPADRDELVLADVCMFVDPVDGTREFVEGCLEAVQCLLGVAYRGRPIAGVVGVPFLRISESGPDSPCTCASSIPHILYGVVGSPSHVAGLPLPHKKYRESSSTAEINRGGDVQAITLAISTDLCRGTAAEAVPIELFGAGEWQTRAYQNQKDSKARLVCAGGCGFKILKVLSGEANAAVMNLKTSLWDTCATQVIHICIYVYIYIYIICI